ncbi:TetR/AcrR family transcriptional regulator [Candidatus Clostridium stratigraminis]|uniref:TetR/AcrR family transcriptional regulator n=1 Tax=Candidatus Clostridium stratigraminis TaxID=3381661 RepID=A0ABW8T1J5_9CLOT
MTRGNREEEILEAAVKIFSDKGYSAATTSEIAKEAGVAEGTIFRYFKTKKDILTKVMVKMVTVMGERIMSKRLTEIFENNKHLNERELLKYLLKDRLAIALKYFDMVKVVLTEIQYHEDLKEAFINNIIMKGKDILSLYFEEGIKKGIFKNIDINIAIRSLLGMMGMFIVQKQFMPELITIDDDKQLDTMLDIFLYGISNKINE